MNRVKTLTPKLNLDNVPICLRKLADEIESGDVDAETVLIVYRSKAEQRVSYGHYGEDMPVSECIGLLEYAKLLMFEER
ncbi:hypothetical protein [Xanthomonas phage XAJ2]|uniref:Uncharacterized protein n=1 Tax=Xanthomonas phage XAJ2 TaxID=1775249 RepID=A0A1I9L2J3_9CAUD|nr:hypothetical protein [Xanthomonas phage XAJ2]